MSRVRVPVRPELLEWAKARSGIDEAVWLQRFPNYEAWLAGTKAPTMKQLADFAKRSYAPIGYFFLDEPPIETVPIPDFRSAGNKKTWVVSANLLDTIYVCQARQEWYRDHQLLIGEEPAAFVGSVAIGRSPTEAGEAMRAALGWSSELQGGFTGPTELLSGLRKAAEEAGVLVMISGIAGANTNRKLDPREFRGFSLVDEYAPLVFINGADSKAAQVFTLVHELAHIWLGRTGLSNIQARPRSEVERWCNQVAAEFLVPMAEFEALVDSSLSIGAQTRPLADHFSVSKAVILGRFREAGELTWPQYLAALKAARAKAVEISEPGPSGGNYYNTKPIQVGTCFARELIASTLEGYTSYTEAFRLLEIRKTSTMVALGEHLGVA